MNGERASSTDTEVDRGAAMTGDLNSSIMERAAPSSIISPMESLERVASVQATPRRKLSMSNMSYENSPSPDGSTSDSVDHGYMSGRSSSLHTSSLSVDSSRCPMSDCSNVRRILMAKRPLKKLSSSSSQDKENTVSPSTSSFKFISPLTSHRPSSLPSFDSPYSYSSSLGSSGGFRGRSYSRQLSSPLERMSLLSPAARFAVASESDGYSDVFDSEELEEDSLTSPLTHLINAPLPSLMTSSVVSNKSDVVCPTPVRPAVQQGESAVKLPCNRRGSLKRASPQNHSNKHKRRPLPFSSNSQDSPPNSVEGGAPLVRSQSCCVSPGETDATSSSYTGEESYIGDFSKKYALPLVKGSCQDLKCISAETLCDLMEGKCKDVHEYRIIDCRYPYEYAGGHIRGAENIWRQEDLLEKFFSEHLQYPQEEVREIFIFHCEFSSKRGPKMSRFLRETDRRRNGMDFPKLYYPELYLLEGGYRKFFESHSELCEPMGYCCMEDDKHVEEYRDCKLRSKSWNGEVQSRCRRLSRHRYSACDARI